MTIAGTSKLVEGGSGGNGYQTSTVNFSGSKFYMLAIGGAPGMGDHLTSVSGCSLTWTKVVTVNGDTVLFYGLGSPTSGKITFNFDSGSYSFNYSATEWSGTSNDAFTIIQNANAFNSGSTVTVNLSALNSAFNATYGFCRNNTGSVTITVGSAIELGTITNFEDAYRTDGGTQFVWSGLTSGPSTALGIAVELRHAASLVSSLAGSANDAQEGLDGANFTYTLDYVQIYCAPSGQDNNRRAGGFRFTNITIPRGSHIWDADIQLYTSQNPIAGADDPKFDIYCEAAANSVDFATTGNVISRARTSASTLWDATNVGELAYKRSPDIAAPVQEVINRVDWSSGNALTVLCIPRVSALAPQFNCWAADKGNSLYAILDVTYTAPAGNLTQLALFSGKRFFGRWHMRPQIPYL